MGITKMASTTRAGFFNGVYLHAGGVDRSVAAWSMKLRAPAVPIWL